MSAAHTLDPEGDNLYSDKARFTNLEATTWPLPQTKEDDLRNLLNRVRIILTHTTPSISEDKEVLRMAKTTEKTESLSGVSETMRYYANNIGQQIVLQDGIDDREKTWRLLETDPEIPLKAKAILSLVAFATMYGRLRLSAKMAESNQLAKSIMMLKREAKVGAEDELKYWFEAISTAINRTLEVADGVMKLKEMSQPNSTKQKSSHRKPMLLSTAVFRIINMVVICWSQVGNILIKRSRKDIYKSNWTLTENERYLKDKDREIEEEVGKEDTRRQAARKVNKEDVKTGVDERGRGLNCWWKLRQMMHPTTVKSIRRSSMLLCTANCSSSHTHTISSTSQGDLPKAAQSDSSG